jgi:anti-sigma regulatory factor (Ser/Thr protein kinase)
MQATGHFARTADQTAAARRFVRATLTDWGIEARVDDVVLMASELFTNEVLHGAGGVDVTVALQDGDLRVEVIDDGGDHLPIRAELPSPGSIGGHGLAIVDALAGTWGKGRDDLGRTHVWLEVPSR